jgi:hypothetical protein
MKTTTEQRFWSKVDVRNGDDCWNWKAHHSAEGYGLFNHTGVPEHACRFAWTLVCGAIPNGMCVHHKCGNRSCVNPKHLYLGKQGDNIFKVTTEEDRNRLFWEKVDIRGKNECWNWTGAKNKAGYGMFKVAVGTSLANRMSYKLAFCFIPEGMCVLHKCDNPSCVNPYHLYAGTMGDNTRDMIERHRQYWANRDRCSMGHEYTPENTLHYNGTKKDSRICKTCKKTKAHEWYIKNKQRLAMAEE